jgi:hypothetical protein
VTAAGVFFNAGANAPTGSYFLSTGALTANNSLVYDTSTLYFVGLISDTPFSSITIGGNNNGPTGFNIDSLTHARSPNLTPEVPGSVQAGAALLALGAMALYKRRKQAIS